MRIAEVLPNNSVKLRYHHVDSLYRFLYDSKFSAGSTLVAEGYTKYERRNAIGFMKALLRMPPETPLEITSFEDLICAGCTRKNDEGRAIEGCYSPDSETSPDTVTTDFAAVMGIQIGRTYRLGEILQKMEWHHQNRDAIVDEAIKVCRETFRYPPVGELRNKLLERGLVPPEPMCA